jgi:general secretion pathway protein D
MNPKDSHLLCGKVSVRRRWKEKQVEYMQLKRLDTTRQKTQKMLKNLFCLLCIFSINLAGGKPDSKPATIAPLQGDITGLTESSRSNDLASKQTGQLIRTSADLAGKKEPAVLMVSSAPPDIPAVSKVNTLPSEAAPVRSIAEILPPSGSNIAAAQPAGVASETNVNLPALDKPGMADELVSVNFDQVDIRAVLKTIGDITGINFVVDENVRGTVTVMSPTKIRLGEVYRVLESILEVQGYAAVPAGGFVKIVPKAEAAKGNLQVRVSSDPSLIPQNDSIVTQIIPLNYANAAEVGQIIQSLLDTGSQMATYPTTNSIVITGTSSNIHHIAMIIQKLDVPGSKEQVTVMGLQYASAQVLSEQITGIMEKSKGAFSQAARTRSAPQTETSMKILPDMRTNSLIVIANAQDTETVRKLIEQLDVQRPVGTTNIHVVYLKNAQAKEVAQSLTAALTNLKIAGALETTQPVQVTADEGTNALIIAASAQDFEVIAQIVEKLDIVREQVLVEMLIMEVSEDALREIGIDWATLDQAVEGSVRGFAGTNFGVRADAKSGDLEGLAVGMWKKNGSETAYGTVLHALEKLSGVNILSTPHILTSNHHKAKIVVGENRPFVMQSRITETDPATPTAIKTYEYKDVGISLEITPHISQGGLVRLEINSEFTKLIEDVTSSSFTDTPTTAKRQAQTVVSMNSGSTVVIGGLIRDDKVTLERKIPLVSDVPLVGNLFKFKRDRLQKTNLLIFITPHVMGSQKDLEQITDEKKKEMEPVMEDLEKKTR